VTALARLYRSISLVPRKVLWIAGDKSFPPSLWLVCASKAYSGLGADIVYESLHSKPANNETEELNELEHRP
jgi:hypothetical protein